MTPLLQVDEARLAFGGLQALGGTSLSVPRGSIFGLIGPNGAGKTTMFNCISGLQQLDGGTVRFDGHDITRLPAHRRARLGIRRSFQHLGLMREETALSNVMAAEHLSAGDRPSSLLVSPGRWRRREVDLAVRGRRALAGFGLEADADRPVEDLSFAAARFVELVAVVVDEPALLLLDEPTTGLDLAEVETLRAALVAVRERGTTVLLIAHDVGFVMTLCDHVYVLAHGLLLAEGPPASVQQDPRVVEAYLGVPA